MKQSPKFTWKEIEKHNTDKSPWLAINGKVYDVSTFQHKHPGLNL
jgi:cytochrome b involved in lipid metabolism